MNLETLFRTVRRLRQKGFSIPLVLLSYYNPIFRFGESAFVREAKRSGVDGVIVPDLPFEEAGGLVRLGRRYDFPFVFLVTPTSSLKRRRAILSRAKGFLYYVSITGTTGLRKRLPPELPQDVRRLKRLGRIPVCIGFGVSTPEMAHRLSRASDGVIVGSALIQKLETGRAKGIAPSRWVERIGAFAERFAKETHR
jgi:tryptophan synthase alpha chain